MTGRGMPGKGGKGQLELGNGGVLTSFVMELPMWGGGWPIEKKMDKMVDVSAPNGKREESDRSIKFGCLDGGED